MRAGEDDGSIHIWEHTRYMDQAVLYARGEFKPAWLELEDRAP